MLRGALHGAGDTALQITQRKACLFGLFRTIAAVHNQWNQRLHVRACWLHGCRFVGRSHPFPVRLRGSPKSSGVLLRLCCQQFLLRAFSVEHRPKNHFGEIGLLPDYDGALGALLPSTVAELFRCTSRRIRLAEHQSLLLVDQICLILRLGSLAARRWKRVRN